MRNHINSEDVVYGHLNLYPERYQPNETIFRRVEQNCKSYVSFTKPNRESRAIAVVDQILNEIKQNEGIFFGEIEANR